MPIACITSPTTDETAVVMAIGCLHASSYIKHQSMKKKIYDK